MILIETWLNSVTPDNAIELRGRRYQIEQQMTLVRPEAEDCFYVTTSADAKVDMNDLYTGRLTDCSPGGYLYSCK